MIRGLQIFLGTIADNRNKILDFYDLFYKSSLPKDLRYKSYCTLEQYLLVETPPLNAIFFAKDSLTQLLTQNQIIEGNAPNQQKINQRLSFNIPLYYSWDFGLFRGNAFNLNSPNQWDIAIRNSSWVGPYTNSYYRFKIYYQAGDSITSSKDWNIYIK